MLYLIITYFYLSLLTVNEMISVIFKLNDLRYIYIYIYIYIHIYIYTYIYIYILK